tara:strand:+ start:320 stop:520 length:201 start_codon:yes stop_codon:yes gene_type:complete
MKYEVDEWVLYCQFPESEVLKDNKIESVILEVLLNDLFYDYRIYLNDGSGKHKKVKEENLLKHNKK